jgi:gliding motility-associated-like protein
MMMKICFSGMAQTGQFIAGLNQNFGQGNSDPATIGTPLANTATAFTFSNALCPAPGAYTIVRRIPVASCFNNEWIGLTRDNTPNMDFGMMMLVNSATTVTTKLVYTDTVHTPLCSGMACRFSVAVINTDVPQACTSGPDFPRFEMRLSSETGQLIKKDTTQPVAYASNAFGYKFNPYVLDFIMPAGVNKIIAKLSLLPGSYLCAEDFAIDDFIVQPLGPEVKIAFQNEPTTIVKSICFQDNSTISITGEAGAYYTNTALQWQQSLNAGVTWSDIPGATTAVYTNTFSTPGAYLFRLTAAEAVNVANTYCRVASNSLRIQCDTTPSGYQLTTTAPICAGELLQFNVNGGARYEWRGPGGFYENVASPQIFNARLADSGRYDVTIISPGGCKATDSIYAVIRGTAVDAGRDTAICMGQSVQLNASAGISCVWSPATALSGTKIFSPKATPQTTTTYTVSVTGRFGCTGTDSVTIKLRNSVQVKAGLLTNGYLCHPADSLLFTDNSAGNITNWQWSFGNGQTATGKNPPVQYYTVPFQNTIQVKLAVNDTTGCADTAYAALRVVDNCYIGVPTAFTPNNDGVNDFLFPMNAWKATKLLFKIYNRLGQLVFATSDWMKPWDGTLRGSAQPVGAYVWTLDYTDVLQRRVMLRGVTTLIR